MIFDVFVASVTDETERVHSFDVFTVRVGVDYFNVVGQLLLVVDFC